MPKGSPEKTAARKEEIISACEKLYQSMSFKDITLKEIGNETSFSRPTIYNYYQTKEEIFLALFEREYIRWNNSCTANRPGYREEDISFAKLRTTKFLMAFLRNMHQFILKDPPCRCDVFYLHKTNARINKFKAKRSGCSSFCNDI